MSDDGNELFPSPAWRLLLPAGEPAEIATDFEPATLARLHHRRSPGEVCYIEAPWPRWRRPSELAWRLRMAGFGGHRIYALAKSDDRWKTSWWVPVGQPAVVSYLLDQRRRVETGRRNRWAASPSWAAALASRSAPFLAAHPWLLHPRHHQVLCVVATRSQTGGAVSDPVPSLALGCATDPTTVDPAALVVAMRVGGSSTDQPMLLVFEGGGSEPVAVIKAPERPEELTGTRHEQRILRRLAAGPSPVAGVPRPIELKAGPAVVTAAQSGIPGRPVTNQATPATYERLARLVTDWLIQLATATAEPAEACSYRTLVERSVRVLDGTTSNSPPFVRDTEKIPVALRSFDPGITVVQHGDLGPWNINLDRWGRVGVIDWAGAKARGVPGCDLVHFLTHLALCAHDGYRPGRRQVLYAAVTDPKTALGRTVDRCLGCYYDGVDLARPDDAALRMLTWTLATRRQTPAERGTSMYHALLTIELDAVGAAQV